MPSSFSTDLKLELMVTGENAGTWGTKTNDNLNVLQQAIAGFKAISIAGGAQTTALLINNSPDIATSDARNAVIKLTGTITGNQIVTVPNGIEKTYIVQNGTTGAFTVEFKTAGGTGVTFASTNKGFKIVYSDGTNIVDVELSSVNPIIEKILDTNGNEEIIFTATASAVNELTIANAATGNAPSIATSGSDTNIDLKLTPKGTGGVIIPQINDTNGNEEIKFTATASAVNELTIANSATGASPTISATGSDTNIGLNLVSKGTGGIVLPAGAVATPALTTTGDLNTGIFFPAADTIAFTEGGAEAMRINSSGNVLIGKTATTNSFPLEVKDGIQTNYVFAALSTLYAVNNASYDWNISSIIGTIPNVENSISFELTLRERSTDSVQLFRLFYIRVGPGTTFNISSAIFSVGSTDATTTISYPSAGNIRFTNTSFSVGSVMIRRISS